MAESYIRSQTKRPSFPTLGQSRIFGVVSPKLPLSPEIKNISAPRQGVVSIVFSLFVTRNAQRDRRQSAAGFRFIRFRTTHNAKHSTGLC